MENQFGRGWHRATYYKIQMGILGGGFLVVTALCYCVICCSKKKNAIKETFLISLNGIVT